jgi:hypothetical protein
MRATRRPGSWRGGTLKVCRGTPNWAITELGLAIEAMPQLAREPPFPPPQAARNEAKASSAGYRMRAPGMRGGPSVGGPLVIS